MERTKHSHYNSIHYVRAFLLQYARLSTINDLVDVLEDDPEDRTEQERQHLDMLYQIRNRNWGI